MRSSGIPTNTHVHVEPRAGARRDGPPDGSQRCWPRRLEQLEPESAVQLFHARECNALARAEYRRRGPVREGSRARARTTTNSTSGSRQSRTSGSATIDRARKKQLALALEYSDDRQRPRLSTRRSSRGSVFGSAPVGPGSAPAVRIARCRHTERRSTGDDPRRRARQLSARSGAARARRPPRRSGSRVRAPAARWPDLPDSWYNLALLQRKLRRFDAALASYQQALDRDVSRPEEVHLNRGVIFSDYLRREDDGGREGARAALALNPDYVPALFESREPQVRPRRARRRARDSTSGSSPSIPRITKALARYADLARGRPRRSADRPTAARRIARSARDGAADRASARLRARQGARRLRRLRSGVRGVRRRQPGEPRACASAGAVLYDRRGGRRQFVDRADRGASRADACPASRPAQRVPARSSSAACSARARR